MTMTPFYIPKYILTIIDMQAEYEAARDTTIQANIVKEIKIARRQKAGIFVVEYRYTTPHKGSLPKLLRAVKKYPLAYCIYKHFNNGSAEVLDAITRLGWNRDLPHLRFVGVNYGACVRETIIGLLEHGILPSRISVVQNCCNQPQEWEEFTGDYDSKNNEEQYNYPQYDYPYSWEGVTQDLIDHGVTVET